MSMNTINSHDEISSFIITITGPSMSGKSYVMDKIDQESIELKKIGLLFDPIRITKFSTRSYRLEELRKLKAHEPVDIQSVVQIPLGCDLVYRTYGNEYGVSSAILNDLLNNNKSPIIVINDVRVVEEIKEKFPGKVLSLFLFRKIPELKDFKHSSASRGNVSPKEAKKRYDKAISIYRTYIENITLFDRVILNVKDYLGLDGEVDYTKLQIHNLISGVISGRIKLGNQRQKLNRKMFIVSGSAASGKDEIIRAVEKLGKSQAFILPKYTTRIQEPNDGLEMICRLIPQKTIIEQLEQEYTKEYRCISEQSEPPIEIVADLKEKFTLERRNEESFEEYLSVKWEAEKLAKLKNLPSAFQRFWLMVENERKKLRRQRKDKVFIERAIEAKLFQANEEYLPIEDIFEKNKAYFDDYTKHQETGVSGPACYIIEDGKGYIIYKNNKDILYAFKISDCNGTSLLHTMEAKQQHCVIAASLTEIFEICRSQLKNEVVTIFAYSQISAENYKKRTNEGTANQKAEAVNMDLERYSKHIEYFDHVSIFAESVYENKLGGAEEELIDQIFRLFRAYG